MEKSIMEQLEVKKFNTFPKTLDDAKHFFEARGFDSSTINEALIKSGVEKVNKGESLTQAEIQAFHDVFDLGDTCGCDSDHRLRGSAVNEERLNYSRT